MFSVFTFLYVLYIIFHPAIIFLQERIFIFPRELIFTTLIGIIGQLAVVYLKKEKNNILWCTLIVIIPLLVSAISYSIMSNKMQYNILRRSIGEDNTESLIKKGYYKSLNVGCMAENGEALSMNFMEGNRLYRKGENRLAILKYKHSIDELKNTSYIANSIDLDKQLSAVYLNLGFAHNADGNIDDAITALEESKRHSNNYIAGYLKQFPQETPLDFKGYSASYQTLLMLYAEKNDFNAVEELM